MADIRKPDDLILPLPETQRDTDLNNTLQDYTKSLNDAFSDLEDIEAITAGDGISDTSNTFSINVDGTSVELNGSDQLSVIDGGVDHDSLANTHNLTTDIDHDTIANNHNLTTDIDHDTLTNFTSTEHFTMLDEDDMDSNSATQAATQQSIKKYVDDNISGSLSNVVFSWSGCEGKSAASYGMYIGDTLAEGAATSDQLVFQYLYSDSSTYQTMLQFRFKKISGISTVTIEARLGQESSVHALLNVDIGGESNNVESDQQAGEWVTTADIDVSSLSDGTTYDGIIQLKAATSGNSVYCYAVTLIAS